MQGDTHVKVLLIGSMIVRDSRLPTWHSPDHAEGNLADPVLKNAAFDLTTSRR
jgi:hypothetical protein